MSFTGISKIRMQAKGLFHSGNKEAAQGLSNIADAYEYLAAEYGRVMELAGYSESREVTEKEALTWIDAANRPAVELCQDTLASVSKQDILDAEKEAYFQQEMAALEMRRRDELGAQS